MVSHGAARSTQLEFLKKLAKDRLDDLRRTNPSAQLADAQLAVAREHGFTSWRALRAHLDRLAPPTPTVAVTATEPSAALVEELFVALRRRDGDTVARLLDATPALVNARHSDGTTPLLDAADRDDAAADMLLRRGADPAIRYAHSAHTPLSWALTATAFTVARALARAGAPIDLWCAAGIGDVDAVRSFFDADGRLGPRASTTGSSRYAADGTRLPCPPESPREVIADALQIACRNGQVDTARELLTRDPDLSFRGFMGATALHWAYFGGSRAIVDMLVRAGADATNRENPMQCTPRAFGICAPANWGWLPKVRQRLAEEPSLVDIMEGRGTPLHEAAREGHLSVAVAAWLASVHVTSPSAPPS